MSPSWESLPPEMFNNVLGYLIGDAAPTHHLEILRVDKGFHALGKSYLDGNAWVKFRINYDRLLYDPTAIGVRTFSVQDARGAKLPTALEIDVRFPDPEPERNFNNQRETRIVIGRPTNGWSSTVLVLAADVPDFLRCIRLQDLTYCARVHYPSTAPTLPHYTHSI
jgi:hypothetical protein